jgi:general secretion pathway protein N
MNIRAAEMATRVLLGVCGVFGAVLLVLYAGYGRGYGWLSDAEGARQLAADTIDRAPFVPPPLTTFAVIDQRPLFNEDRRPAPIEATAATDAPPQVPLNIQLTGVIVTPDTRIALITDKTRNQPLSLKVGMPLEGDQGAWTLVEISPRSVVFESINNERSEVELEVAGAITPPPNMRPPGGAPPPGGVKPPPAPAPGGQPVQSGSSNEDLAKRIEARRRQMREEAEKLRQQQQTGENKSGENK